MTNDRPLSSDILGFYCLRCARVFGQVAPGLRVGMCPRCGNNRADEVGVVRNG